MKRLLVVFLVVGLVNCGAKERSKKDVSLEVHEYIKKVVKGELKTPSTAVFKDGTFDLPNAISYTDADNSTWKAFNYVQSTNGYGATVKTWYTCLVKIEEGIMFKTELEFKQH